MASTTTAHQIFTSGQAELTKPIRPIRDLPDPSAHKELRAGLKKHGLSDRAAGAIAYIWTDPAAILAQLDNPQIRRIPGAYLKSVIGPAYTARLAPDPSNPRNADRVQFALAEVNGPPAALLRATEIGVGEMGIQAVSRTALLEQLEWAIETTRERTTPRPSIEKQGIMDPPIGVATTVYYEDPDVSPTTHIFVREGSTRISHGLYYLGVDAEAILFGLPRGASPMQSHIAQINGYTQKAADEILPSEEAAVRCAVTEFELIIGVVPDTLGTVDLAQAIKARVAQDHLNPKAKWSDESKHTSLAEECLIAARSAGVIPTDQELDWLSGRLTRSQAAARKINAHSDDRAARIINLFTTNEPKTRNAVREPIALVLTEEEGSRRRRVTSNAKLPLAIELISRELNGAVPETKLGDFRKTLKEALPPDLSTRNWAPSNRSPEEMFKAATQELVEGETGGPSGTELVVRAAYVLAKYGMIRNPRHDRGEENDRRPAHEVIGALLETDTGLMHLRQALEDDRNGLRPRQVDAQGQPRPMVGGGDVLIDNKLLRTKLAPKNGAPQQPVPPGDEARRQYKFAIRTIKAKLRDISDDMRYLETIEEDGIPLVEREGRADARLLRDTLRNMADKAEGWWEAAMDAGAIPRTDTTDTDGDATSAEAVLEEESG
ncbi:hypothetical protein [Sinosporangium siamense]|uniref:Uncharacterized protein n=1 Tax=Sinosporangium siamense TaxID=1367973 RepID=A0A919V535_9ACTN|nr:hypothetical protein [Sinosporangium siamense]GII91143.1 hypothetical protein Ssi02_13740 [Sinosporangium siamense]